MLSRMGNDVLGNAMGLAALDGALTRATDALLKRKNKKGPIIDLDSTEDPAFGKQEGVAYNGHFAKNCFHPLFSFTSEGDCLGAKLRPASQRASGHLGIGMPEIWKKLTLITELCYFCLYGKDCLGEADRLRVFPRSKGLRKPVWNHCSRGCRIISVN